jgi:osmoprotectant transport system permease protein
MFSLLGVTPRGMIEPRSTDIGGRTVLASFVCDETSWLPFGDFRNFVCERKETLGQQASDHTVIVLESMIIATVISLLLAMLVYRSNFGAKAAISVTSVFLTIPSLALLGLLIPYFGLGSKPTIIALVSYALLPIVRNAVVGLRGVDPNLVDSARGMGMSRLRVLLRVELPIAWPVVLTGIRVSTQLIMGIAAIAAIVRGPGFGESIFSGLARIGSVNSVNSTLAGTLGVVLLALLFDLGFQIVGRLTTPRGLRG